MCIFANFDLQNTGDIDMLYDVIIVGAGPGGIFSAYQLTEKNSDLKIAVFEAGNELKKRK